MKISPAIVADRAKLPLAILEDPNTEISTDQAFAFWRALEDIADDRLLGFKLLRAASKVGTDTTFLAATRAASMRAGLDSYIQTRRLHSPARIVAKQAKGLVRYTRYIPGAVSPEPTVSVDFTLGTLLSLARIGTGRHIAATRVDLAREAPGLPFHREFYGCTVLYGAQHNTITFRSVDLDLPFVSHDAEAVDALTASICESIRRRLSGETIDNTVKAAIKKVMHECRPDLASVAIAIGLSERSLQRRIAERGTTFRDLLIAARQDVAQTMLADPKVRMDAVAHRLGYADTASFLRAFRSWHGMSPTQWRRLLGA